MTPQEQEIHTRLHAALAAGDDSTVAEIAHQLDTEDHARRERLLAPDALATAARWYAANGIAVFPLRVGDKKPLLPKAHPEDDDLQRDCKRACGRDGHGLYDATTDVARVQDWWRATPQANIGMRTGHLFDVIDVDPPHGWESLAELRAAGIVPPTIGYAHTPRGGLHLYIAPTGDGNTTDVAGLPNVDYRGAGGYVVAPPSRVEDGMWVWTSPLIPAELAPRQAP